VLLLGGAALWRWIQWSRSAAIFNDGPGFLAAAAAFRDGRFAEALAQPQHPLYPIAVAIVHATGVGWEDAGALVSIAGGTLAVACVALFCREAFGATAGWIAGGLLAVHSRAVEYSSDVQSDGLYLGLFALALWVAWRAIGTRSPRWAAATGAVAGLAYLTRPEGLGIALILAGWAFVAGAFAWWTRREAAVVVVAVALAAACVAAPYAASISRAGAGIALTHKKSAALGGATPSSLAPAPPPIAPAAQTAPDRTDRGDEGLAVARAPSGARRVWEALWMEARTLKSAFRYGPLVLAFAGIASCFAWPARRGLFALAIAAVYTAVLFGLALQSAYVSRRHALPPLLPLFGYAGLGAIWTGAWIARLAHRPRAATLAAGLVAAAFAAGELAGQIAPRRAEERAAVEAARWLRDHAPAAPLVTDRQRLGYYAGMPYVPFVRADDAVLRSFFDRVLDPSAGPAGARYVLLDDPDDVAAVRRAAGTKLRPMHRIQRGGREAWIFERAEPGTP